LFEDHAGNALTGEQKCAQETDWPASDYDDGSFPKRRHDCDYFTTCSSWEAAFSLVAWGIPSENAGMSFFRFALQTLALIILLVACKPAGSPSPVALTSQDVSLSVLKMLHHAAEEMALDGFQFDKPALGWPHDIRAASRAAYLAVLRENRYLAEEVAPEIDVANVAEIDPLDTALFRIRDGSGGETVIRKDGVIDPAARMPPRDPAWLP
jgi:hypothetical protein